MVPGKNLINGINLMINIISIKSGKLPNIVNNIL